MPTFVSVPIPDGQFNRYKQKVNQFYFLKREKIQEKILHFVANC